MGSSKCAQYLRRGLKFLLAASVAVITFFITVFIPLISPYFEALLPDVRQGGISYDVYEYVEMAFILLMCALDFLFPYLILRLFKLRPKWPWLVLMGVATTLWTLFCIFVLLNVND